MKNLSKLKNAPDIFTKISVTDDDTAEERQAIRNKLAEARNKTDSKGNEVYVFKVRGTPKNGLILKRFMKAQVNAH